MNNEIGLVILTHNRPHFAQALWNQLYDNVKDIGISHTIIVNDGKPIFVDSSNKWTTDITDTRLEFHEVVIHQNEVNLGIGKSKNIGLRYLMEQGCKHLFLLEDDVVVKNINVFQKYIDTSRTTGIQHLNYGPGSPFNRKQIQSFDLHNRHELSTDSTPNPKLVIDYGTSKIALYEHSVGMFSYFTRAIIEEVGYMDEQFVNAWEHVEHTYRIIKAGGHPPFWTFADISDSDDYLGSQKEAISESTTSKNQDAWLKNVYEGRELYKSKHGYYPNTTPLASKEEVIESLKNIKTKWKI